MLTYEQITLLAGAAETRAEALDVSATAALERRSSDASPESRERNVSLTQHAALLRKRAADLRAAADAAWTFRRTLPDAPLFAPSHTDSEG